jgi:TrmH family RNA methyltransferase
LTFSLRVVLVSPRNPLNIGAAARAMSNFGFTEMSLVNPYDLAYREARSAVRSRYILEQSHVFERVHEAVADCTLVVGTSAGGNRDLHVPSYRLETAGSLIRHHLETGKVALLFGSEKFGLSNDDMSHCHWLTRIPTRDQHASMNLGQAVAICLYELMRDGAAALAGPFIPPARAGAAEAERLTSVLMSLMVESGYAHERTMESTELKLRRLVHRMGISAVDATSMAGMLKHVLWKIQHPNPSPE